MTITVEDLRKCRSATTMFADLSRGGAIQSGHFVGHPRLTWVWTRKTRMDNGAHTYAVDGEEVGSLAEAAQRLNRPKVEA